MGGGVPPKKNGPILSLMKLFFRKIMHLVTYWSCYICILLHIDLVTYASVTYSSCTYSSCYIFILVTYSSCYIFILLHIHLVTYSSCYISCYIAKGISLSTGKTNKISDMVREQSWFKSNWKIYGWNLFMVHKKAPSTQNLSNFLESWIYFNKVYWFKLMNSFFFFFNVTL